MAAVLAVKKEMEVAYSAIAFARTPIFALPIPVTFQKVVTQLTTVPLNLVTLG